MPRPSRVWAPCSRAQVRKGSAAGPYIRSTTSAPGASVLAATGEPAPCRLLALALISNWKPVPASFSPLADSSQPLACASPACRCTRASAVARVRLASTTRCGRACSSGPSTPAPAPPAPTNSTLRPARLKPAPCWMSRIRPTPSVLSADHPPASKRSTLAAPASAARSLTWVARAGACSLKGTVMLQPRPPSATNWFTAGTKPSSGHSTRP